MEHENVVIAVGQFCHTLRYVSVHVQPRPILVCGNNEFFVSLNMDFFGTQTDKSLS